MRDTCTLNALGLIDDLCTELYHLKMDGLDAGEHYYAVISLKNIRDIIRREYVRLHPNESVPEVPDSYRPWETHPPFSGVTGCGDRRVYPHDD